METANEKRYASAVKGISTCFFRFPIWLTHSSKKTAIMIEQQEFVIRGFSELLSEWDGSLIDCLYKQHDGISADLCVPRHLCNCLRYRPPTSGIQPVAHASPGVSRWVHMNSWMNLLWNLQLWTMLTVSSETIKKVTRGCDYCWVVCTYLNFR
jgi:hypothetical protein